MIDLLTHNQVAAMYVLGTLLGCIALGTIIYFIGHHLAVKSNSSCRG